MEMGKITEIVIQAVDKLGNYTEALILTILALIIITLPYIAYLLYKNSKKKKTTKPKSKLLKVH